jgi:hypothetical protein
MRFLFLTAFWFGTALGQTSQSTVNEGKAATQSFSKVKNQTSNTDLNLCVNQAGTEKCRITVQGASPGTVTIGESGSSGPQNINGTVAITNQGGNSLILKKSSGASLNFWADLVGSANTYSIDNNSGTFRIYNHAGTATATANQAGKWTFGTVSSDRNAVFANNDTGQNSTVYMANLATTVNDIGEQILVLNFDGTTNPTGGYFAYFRDNDTSPMGSITAASATTVAFNTSSDARLKYDIKPLKNALKRTLQLTPSSFKWKQGDHFDEGFIAQNVKKVYPTAVHGNESGDPKVDPMQVDYGKLTPLLAAAIKELAEENRQLKARLDAAGL